MSWRTNRKTMKRFRNPFRKEILEQDDFDFRENDILLSRIQERISLLSLEEQVVIMRRVEERGGFFLDMFIHDPRFKYIFDERAKELLAEMEELRKK
jgi:hypothetical protein